MSYIFSCITFGTIGYYVVLMHLQIIPIQLSNILFTQSCIGEIEGENTRVCYCYSGDDCRWKKNLYYQLLNQGKEDNN